MKLLISITLLSATIALANPSIVKPATPTITHQKIKHPEKPWPAIRLTLPYRRCYNWEIYRLRHYYYYISPPHSAVLHSGYN